MLIRSTALMLAGILISSMAAFTAAGSTQQGEPSPTQFFQNGTGVVHFVNGTVLYFNHTLTPQNGYLYENGTIYYVSNGTQVDLTKVDKNSLIITDIIQPQQQQQPLQQQPVVPPPTTTPSTTTTINDTKVIIDRV
jgi:hypothetical protein